MVNRPLTRFRTITAGSHRPVVPFRSIPVARVPTVAPVAARCTSPYRADNVWQSGWDRRGALRTGDTVSLKCGRLLSREGSLQAIRQQKLPASVLILAVDRDLDHRQHG